MIKKVSSMIIATMLCLSFSGCNNTESGGKDSSSKQSKSKNNTELADSDNTTNDVAAANADPEKITFLTIEPCVINSESLDEVNQKLKEHGVSKEVQFISFDATDYQNSVDSWENLGNKADIMFSGFATSEQPIATYKTFVDEGKFICLDDYLDSDEGVKLKETYTENYWDSLKIDGKIYGLSYFDTMGYSTYQVTNDEACEKVGLDLSNFDGDWSKFEDKAKDKGSIILYDFDEVLTYEDYFECPTLNNFGIGIIKENGNFKAVNKFEQSEKTFKSIETLLKNGIVNINENQNWLFRFSSGTYDYSGYTPLSSNVKTSSKQIKTSTVKQSNVVTGVCSDCENKDDAFKVLALINSDEEIANLLKHGIEGENYTMTDGLVTETDGSNQLWLQPNDLVCLPIANAGEEKDKREKIIKYNNSLEENPLMNFRADFSNINAQKLAAAYNEIIEWWTNDVYIDPTSEEYKDYEYQFSTNNAIQKLKSAGIDDVLAELNLQLEAIR